MHIYASDNFVRGPKVYFALGATAIALTSCLRALIPTPLTGYIDSGAVSAGLLYSLLICIYELWGWRLSTLPNLNGTWGGEITSTYKGKSSFPCVVRVRQSWTRMSIELETAQSRSQSTMVALHLEQPCDNGIKYEYISEPKPFATQTMQIHRGMCTLTIVPGTNGKELCGAYFTGRGRKNRGEIKLRHINRDLLGFEAAQEKK